MESLRVLSASEQVAEHLKGELLRGRWTGVMIGEDRLMARLGVGRNTIKAALRHLEDEGLLRNRGAGRQRVITLPDDRARRSLRVKILLYERGDRGLRDDSELFHQLQNAGHAVGYAGRSLKELGMDVARIARSVRKTPADAWIVYSGSREVLKWFADQPIPAIAVYGRFAGLPIAAACPRKIPTLRRVVQRMVSLGHRRIVMVTRQERRVPKPALFEQAFLDELNALGVPTGSYNLPDWEESPTGFHAFLDSLFRYTPPTALLFDEPELFVAARLHLADRGIVAPRDVSMICGDFDPSFAWCDPVVAHFRWSLDRVIRRIVRWTDNVAHGKDDRRHYFDEAEFVEGGTIGPAVES